MKPEILFLKYAYPCSFVLLSRKEITSGEHDLLYRSTRQEKLYLPKDKIEKIFWRAIKFVKSISNLETVREYWWFEHNRYLKLKKFKQIEDKLTEECMVIPCEILSVSRNEATVKSPFLNRTVKIKTDFVDVKSGDKITKHYDYICEKIPEGLYFKIEESLKKIGFNNSQG